MILFLASGLIHPPLAGVLRLRSLLGAAGYALRPLRSFESLSGLELTAYPAMVLYIHQRRASPQALANFERYVLAGGGVLAIHSATASFKQDPGFAAILGGRFAGHGPIIPLALTPTADPGPFAGLGGFMVSDEPYEHEMQPGARVHFEALTPAGNLPMIWTHLYGKGRVCYACPGHRAAAFSHPAYRQALLHGLAWCISSA